MSCLLVTQLLDPARCYLLGIRRDFFFFASRFVLPQRRQLKIVFLALEKFIILLLLNFLHYFSVNFIREIF